MLYQPIPVTMTRIMVGVVHLSF
jgi:hypothetical protein